MLALPLAQALYVAWRCTPLALRPTYAFALVTSFLGGAASADEQSCAVGAAFADWLVICVLLRQRSSFCPTVLVYVARVVGVGGSHGSHG